MDFFFGLPKLGTMLQLKQKSKQNKTWANCLMLDKQLDWRSSAMIVLLCSLQLKTDLITEAHIHKLRLIRTCGSGILLLFCLVNWATLHHIWWHFTDNQKKSKVTHTAVSQSEKVLSFTSSERHEDESDSWENFFTRVVIGFEVSSALPPKSASQ